MKTGIIAVLLGASLAAPALAAQDVIALQIAIDDHQDGLNLNGLEGQIELLTVSGGITSTGSVGGGGGGTGKAVATPYTLVKHVDASSPGFLVAVATGKHFETATISFNRERANGVQQYLKIELSDVLVSSQVLNGSENHAGRDTELVTLSYAKACLAYRPQVANGALGAEVKTCYNFSLGRVE